MKAHGAWMRGRMCREWDGVGCREVGWVRCCGLTGCDEAGFSPWLSGLLQPVEPTASSTGARVTGSTSCSCQTPGEKVSIKQEPCTLFRECVWCVRRFCVW